MNALVINTAGRNEVLVLRGEKSYYYSSAQTALSSEELLPRIDSLLNEAELDVSDIDYFGCVIGPGSFTGIRVGVSAVRAFCYALNKPAVAVTYFDLLAYNITPPFTVMIDGGNGVAYVKNYSEQGSDEGKCVLLSAFAPEYDVVADKEFCPLAVGKVARHGAEPLKKAFLDALNRGAIGYERLIPVYLRRSQPEREPGEI